MHQEEPTVAAQNPHNNHHHYHCHVDGTDNSDVNACPPLAAASKPLSPIISHDMSDHEVILELETKVETYEGLPAPCVDDCCLLHPVISDITCNAISTDMQLLSSKFETPRSRRLLLQLGPAVKIEPGLEYSKEESSTSGSSSVSESGSFFCPVQGCLTTISNTTIPTSMEFIATVAHHISTHDLSEGDTERVLMIYLAKPWKRPVRPKAWDVTAKQLNIKTPMLNLHAYWILNAKKNHDQQEPSHISTTALTRSARKRVAPRARIHVIPSSSSTTSPRSTPAVRQMRVASTSSVTQFSDPFEAIPSATPFQHSAIETTAKSTQTSPAQETIATSTSFVRRGPRQERYRRNEGDSSSSPVRRGRLRRPLPSNNSNHSGNENVGPVKKRQHDGRPLRIDVLEDDDGAGTGMRTGSAHGSRRGRFQSRGWATVRGNELQPTRWCSRSRSKVKPDINATEITLSRSARSRSEPRPFRSTSVSENQLSGPCKIEPPKDPFHSRPRMDDYVQVILGGSEDEEEDGMIDYFLYSAEARKKMARQQRQAAESYSSSTSPPNTRVVAESILPDKAIF